MAKKVAARTLDFSNVKDSSGINPKHVEDGEYLAKCIEVRDDPAKDGEAMWLFVFKLVDGGAGTYPYYCKLVDNQLWKLRNLFIAAGVDLPKRAVKIDPNKILNKEVGLLLETEEYEGKEKSVIDGIIPKTELAEYAGTEPADDDDDEDDDEEEAPAPKKRGRPKKVVEEDEDDDEEEEEPAPKKRGRPKKVVEPEEDDDDEEEEEEPAPVKRGRGRPKKVVVEEEDDDDEEEEPAPVKRGRGRPKKVVEAPKKKKRRVADDDDDDLDLDL